MRRSQVNVDIPSRNEQASEWCVRVATGSLSPSEQAAFDAWTRADPANSRAFDQALTVWQGMRAIVETPEIISHRADALDALRRANRQRWSRRLTSRWRWPLAAAASFLLVAFAGLWLLANTPRYYATGLGERRTLILSDGSRLSLDAETKVAVRFLSDRRDLRLLSGRAKFDVAHDLRRPFSVEAGDRTVIATGTAFSVELLGRQVHVIVYDGHVAVVNGKVAPRDLLRLKEHPGHAAISVSPGTELVATADSRTAPQLMPADISRSLTWEGGQFNFVDEPLASAVERLNRYNANKMVIADDRTAAIEINGVFNAGDTAAFVEAVSAVYPVRVSHEGEEIVLSSRAP